MGGSVMSVRQRASYNEVNLGISTNNIVQDAILSTLRAGAYAKSVSNMSKIWRYWRRR